MFGLLVPRVGTLRLAAGRVLFLCLGHSVISFRVFALLFTDSAQTDASAGSDWLDHFWSRPFPRTKLFRRKSLSTRTASPACARLHGFFGTGDKAAHVAWPESHHHLTIALQAPSRHHESCLTHTGHPDWSQVNTVTIRLQRKAGRGERSAAWLFQLRPSALIRLS